VKVIRHPVLDSTNIEAKRLAETGNWGPLWVVADKQTAGTGRRGREWVSDTGNLFCTGLFPYEGDVASAARLSFAAALAVAETLDHYIDTNSISIKWPNDVLVGGEKVSGILLESGTDQEQLWVAVGIGINLMSAPQDTETPATHVLRHMSNNGDDLGNALNILIERFEHWYGTYSKNGFEPLRTAWLERAQGLGGVVTVRIPNKTIQGTAIGLEADGALSVKTHCGEIVKIHAGDVFFL